MIILKDQDEKKTLKVDIVTLATTPVRDELGVETKMVKLWQSRPAVFVFLRHFACIGCRSQAQELWRDREKYEKTGARLIFIGNGTSDFIKKFKEDLGIQDAPVFTDPTLYSFRAAGFKRGFLAALGPKSLGNMAGMKLNGKSGAPYSADAGDLWQLGGILVIKTDGRVIFHHIAEAVGDFPPEKDLIQPPPGDSMAA